MGNLVLRTEHRQQQTLSPRLQHAVRLLQLSSLDFAQEVHDALGRNPFLEAEESDPDAGSEAGGDDGGLGELPLAGTSPAGELPAIPTADGDGDGDGGGGEDGPEGYGDRDLWQADGSGGSPRSEDGETSVMDMMAVETSLADHLHQQINVLALPARDLQMARAIVESLDDDGYLRTSLEELIDIVAQLGPMDPPPRLDELQVALARVQSLEPAGVAARSVGECLLLQLPAIACPLERQLAQRIVSEHLKALAAKDVTGMARALGRSVSEIETCCERIRRLDPRPGWRFGSTQVQYVIPDVMVKKVRGDWTVQLNPSIVPKVRLNHVYAELFQRHRCADDSELAQHLQEARWTLRNVEQRFATILSVAQAIIKRQKHFLEFGAMAMKPLGLREIADEVGLHESTVSRVTNNKYMATPLGVFELKYFFSRAMTTASGADVSGTAIRGLIKDMIEAEDPTAPLSDAEIARLLAKQGLVVARRTVTKYRQLLKIEAVERRRRHSAVA